MDHEEMRYMTRIRGQIAAVLIIKMQYPKATWATVSLLVADASRDQEPRWAYCDGVFYDERLNDQLDGVSVA